MYFITSNTQTKVFPTAFNTATVQTNTVHTLTVTGQDYNNTVGSLTENGAYTAYAANLLAGKLALVTAGSFVTNDQKIKYTISSNNANRIVIPPGSLGASSDGANDVVTSIQISAFGANDTVVLRGLNVLTRPGADDTITFCDKAGTNLWGVSIPTNPLAPLPFDFAQGVEMPLGGFGVSTTVAGSVYQYIFTVTPSLV